MTQLKKTLLLLLLTPLFLLAQPKIALQVLGSGKSRVLVDFGGGASLRFEQAGAKIEDLEVILLTHLHIDHTADLPALLKSSFFVKRTRDLPLYGPTHNNFMPGTKNFIERLFANNKGAWEYMGDYLDGRAAFQLKAHTIAPTKTVKTLYKQGDLAVQAITVHHGPIPALAYRVTVGSKSITFSGDMNGDYHTLEKLARGTDILVAHNAVPKGATGAGANLHMTPFTIGKIAQNAGVKSLVLSHRMLRTLKKGSETKREIRKTYRGPVKFANDLSLYRVK